MSALLARIVMAIAMRSLGPHRHSWKLAMEAEFDAAVAGGDGLPFATGCLTTAWRELPAHIEGRLTLTSYTIIVGLILPAAALLLVGILVGYPFIHPPYADSIGSFARAEAIVPRLNAGNAGAIPSLALILMLRVGSDALVAWFAAERDWTRAAAAQRFGAAATVTLALFAGMVVQDETCLVLPALTLVVEAVAVALLRQLYGETDPRSAVHRRASST
ncbi:hypothetical protein [Sphingomonas sp. 2SG]|uniref:hypothetical protein n=1 Tax=Sphingomonas sp. 2SG TaxID=2502201 RepID=UPI0010F6C276|nr:hypothetical protein [Sphingomonas sp. 2SG]